MPRRILYVDLAPAVGGSIISLYQLLQGLDRRRYEPSVVLSAGNGYISRFHKLGIQVFALGEARGSSGAQERVEAVRQSGLVHWLKHSSLGERFVHLVGFYLREYPLVRRKAAALYGIIRQVEPQLVHLNDVVCVSRPGILAARRAGVPALCHLRALAWRNHFDRWLSHSLQGYICISQAVERHQRRLGGRTSPCWVVYNGVDLSLFEGLPSRGEVRTALGFSAEHFIIGCVGRLVPWKGQHVLLRALAELAPHYPQLRVLFVGAPEAHSRGYEDELKRLAHELRVASQVSWLGFRDDVPRLLRGMDLLVHASVAPEPFGRVLIEGMAAGVPVIGTAAGAVPEIIRDGETGLLVPPGDVQALARAILRALSAPEERALWVQKAHEEVAEKFSLSSYVEGVQRVYERVLS